MRPALIALFVVAILSVAGGRTAAEPKSKNTARKPGSAAAVFQKRILPIFQAKKPSSCIECHLSGVDLKEYIHPSQEKTFASLVKGGLIDVAKPDDSKILKFINRRPKKPNLITDPNLITEKVRKLEYDAFRSWIHAAVKDPKLLAAKPPEDALGPRVSDEVIRHARKDRVLSSFLKNVWSEVGRCANCHSPNRNQKQVRKHGDQVSWIKLRNPTATLKHMLAEELIDTTNPGKSLLLAKPTLQVEHGGGKKMNVGDRTYKQFRRFIDDYAAIINNRYKDKSQLPKPSEEASVLSGIWLKIVDIPSKYNKKLLQVDLYRKTENGWSKHRVATSDRPVFGKKKLWQHSLSLTAPRGSKLATRLRSKRLPRGRYLVKISIDQTGKLQKDYRAELGKDDVVCEVEITSRWLAGYGRMTVVRFPVP